MRRFILPIIGVVFCLSFTHRAFAQAANGVFMVVKGDVEVKSPSGEVKKARLGMKVLPKDKVKTGKDSRAKIVMVDKNELNVNPESEIEISAYEYKPNEGKKDVLINVLYGKMRAKVEQKYEGDNKFQVKTKSAVAGVRGTDFFTAYNPSSNSTRIVTFEGRVQFGMPGPGGQILNPVFVSPGQTSTNVAGAPPDPPMEVPKSELKAFDQGSDANSNGPAPKDDSSGQALNKKEDGKDDKGKGDEKADAQPKQDKQDKQASTDKEGGNKQEGQKQDGPKQDGPKQDGPKQDGPKQDGKGPGPAAGGTASNNGPKGPNGPDMKGPGGPGPGPGGPNMGGPNAAGDGRAPASLPGPGPMPGGGPNMGPPSMGGMGPMMRPEDLATGPGGNMMPPQMPGLPPMPGFAGGGFMPPPSPNVGLPDCDFCRGIIEDGTRVLILNVQHNN